jgi:hypothetical protein
MQYNFSFDIENEFLEHLEFGCRYVCDEWGTAEGIIMPDASYFEYCRDVERRSLARSGSLQDDGLVYKFTNSICIALLEPLQHGCSYADDLNGRIIGIRMPDLSYTPYCREVERAHNYRVARVEEMHHARYIEHLCDTADERRLKKVITKWRSAVKKNKAYVH